MKPQIPRGILGLLCIVYVPVYLFVLFVALVTGGNELIRQPGAWYAAVVPLAYVGFVCAYVLASRGGGSPERHWWPFTSAPRQH